MAAPGGGGIPAAPGGLNPVDQARAEEYKSRTAQTKELANFLKVLGDKVAGRGVPKNDLTPAQRQGLFPQNPRYFGIQQKYPIPYDRIAGNGRNLQATLTGFQEAKMGGGWMPTDTAAVLANVQRTSGLISSAFDQRTTSSLYAGVPKSAAINLYEIDKKNARENSLYAFV